jgi:hypothetical protein
MVFLLSYLLSALACTALYPAVGTASARRIDRKHVQDLQRQAADRLNKNRLAVPSVEGGGIKNITFSNPAASGGYLPHARVSSRCVDRGVRGSVLCRWENYTGSRLGRWAQLGRIVANQREQGRDPEGEWIVPLVVPGVR